jgi:NitT/TauT family transport system substrate-binding protein
MQGISREGNRGCPAKLPGALLSAAFGSAFDKVFGRLAGDVSERLLAAAARSARTTMIVVATVVLAGALFLGACAGGNEGATGGPSTSGGTGAAGGGGGGGQGVGLATAQATVGTMITEDFLPLWVAEQEGVFEQEGVDAELVTFQSAQELTTALAAGEIDMAMTDPMVAATLTQGGAEVTMEWVTLGETAAQGRFGIMTSPESGVKSLADLAGRPIGVGSNTVLEYVMDKLMEQAGVSADQVMKEEIKKIPVRYEMMTNNQVAAAALPASLLYLGEQTGMVLVADDTVGSNLSQSVMVARKDFMATAEGTRAVEKVRASWDAAVGMIGADPAAYRALLVEKASLPEVIAENYPVSTYPLANRPTNETIDPILAWMLDKGYLEAALQYDSSTGAFVR